MLQKTSTRQAPVYNGVTFENYLVSTTGKVFNRKTGRELKQWSRASHNRPDDCVQLCENGKSVTVKVARLVLETFIPKPFSDATVNHKNFDIHWNNLKNLEWCTFAENSRHYFAAKRNGTYKKSY